MQLPKMEQDIAQKMLDKHLINPADDKKKAYPLLKELSYLPLAIVQAAAYINVNKITLKDYLCYHYWLSKRRRL